jgi:hypothetical protein
VIPQVKEFLKIRGLEVSETKTRIINLGKDKLSFLGWEISIKNRNYRLNNQSCSGNKLILIIKPTYESIKNIKRSLKLIFQTHKPMIALIRDLNLKLRG